MIIDLPNFESMNHIEDLSAGRYLVMESTYRLAGASSWHAVLSNRLRRQADLKSGVQVVLDLTMALRTVSSLRMQAISAILGSLPALVSRS